LAISSFSPSAQKLKILGGFTLSFFQKESLAKKKFLPENHVFRLN